jgi:transposase
MDFKRHIIGMLGLQDVEIEDFKRSKRRLKIEIKVRQKRSECFCKHCGQQFSHVKDWSLKTLLAPPLGVYKKVTVKFMQLRGYCEDCDVTSVAEAEWIHQRFDNMTCGFAEVAGRLMEETTCEAVSRILHTDSKLMWRLDQHRMEVMLQFLKLPKNLDLTYLAADEVHFRSIKNKNRTGLVSKRSTPYFVTNLVAPKAGKVLFNAMGRDSEALETSLSILSDGQKLAVENFAVDMHDAFISVIKTECENANIVNRLPAPHLESLRFH